jgi:RNA polymerase sigma-70 factor (ECF subfamily)
VADPHDVLAGFGEVYKRCFPAVHGYLRARVLKVQDTDDLCQEVFFRAFKLRERFRPEGEPRLWLLGIARNVLREYVRRVRRSREVAWTELCLELDETVTAGSQYEDYMPLLPVCVTELGDSARQALDLRYTAGLSMEETAARLERTVGAVKVLLVRARQALRRCLEARVKGQRP